MFTIVTAHFHGLGIKYRRRKVWNIGGPRFRILGGVRGANSQQAHDVLTTSIRRNDVASTSCAHKVLINQCQIITFLILKSYNM